jgi:hypothetical protein
MTFQVWTSQPMRDRAPMPLSCLPSQALTFWVPRLRTSSCASASGRTTALRMPIGCRHCPTSPTGGLSSWHRLLLLACHCAASLPWGVSSFVISRPYMRGHHKPSMCDAGLSSALTTCKASVMLALSSAVEQCLWPRVAPCPPAASHQVGWRRLSCVLQLPVVHILEGKYWAARRLARAAYAGS